MNSDEIWHASVQYGFTVCCQTWTGLVKGDWYNSPPKCEHLVKTVIFWQFLRPQW